VKAELEAKLEALLELERATKVRTEKDAVSARKSGQLQPFTAVFP
jgi:hypothetical protein